MLVPSDERRLLEAARNGDEAAFAALIEPHRPVLHALCYQLLASVHDAEDAAQETELRAWRRLGSFDGRSALGTWLHRVATNICLDLLRKRSTRVLPVDYGPQDSRFAADAGAELGPGEWIEPYPDEAVGIADGRAAPDAQYELREAVELAFVSALQLLPPRQRVVLVLRDALGFSAAEVAETLGATVPAVNSALQRARRTVADRVPDRTQQSTIRHLGDTVVRRSVDSFVDAFERADVDSILALLSENAVFSMPPYAEWTRGREEIGRSWLMPSGPAGELRYLRARSNGQVALGVYSRDAHSGEYAALALDVLAFRDDGLIGEVLAFRTPELFGRFELPAVLAP